jgi:hypothetical protein
MDQLPELRAGARRHERERGDQGHARDRRPLRVAQDAERHAPAAGDRDEPAPPRAERRQGDPDPTFLHQLRRAEEGDAEGATIAGWGEGVRCECHACVDRAAADCAEREAWAFFGGDGAAFHGPAPDIDRDLWRCGTSGPTRRRGEREGERAIGREGEPRRAEDQRRAVVGPAVGRPAGFRSAALKPNVAARSLGSPTAIVCVRGGRRRTGGRGRQGRG